MHPHVSHVVLERFQNQPTAVNKSVSQVRSGCSYLSLDHTYIEYSIQLLKVTMIRVFCQMQLLATFFYAHKVHYTKLLCNSNYENRLLKLTHNISPHRSKRESLGIKAYLCPVLFSISSFITVINCSIGSDSDFFS